MSMLSSASALNSIAQRWTKGLEVSDLIQTCDCKGGILSTEHTKGKQLYREKGRMGKTHTKERSWLL